MRTKDTHRSSQTPCRYYHLRSNKHLCVWSKWKWCREVILIVTVDKYTRYQIEIQNFKNFNIDPHKSQGLSNSDKIIEFSKILFILWRGHNQQGNINIRYYLKALKKNTTVFCSFDKLEGRQKHDSKPRCRSGRISNGATARDIHWAATGTSSL